VPITTDEVRGYLSKPYSRVLLPDPSGGYFAQILEFPGCFSQGETADEAIANLEEAMAGWIEAALELGQSIPPPEASYGHSGHVALRLPKSLHREAARRAKLEGTSLNQFLTTAIAARLGAADFADRLVNRLLGSGQRLTIGFAAVAMLSVNLSDSAERSMATGPQNIRLLDQPQIAEGETLGDLTSLFAGLRVGCQEETHNA